MSHFVCDFGVVVVQKWLEIEGMQELSQPEIKERVMTILDEMITLSCLFHPTKSPSLSFLLSRFTKPSQ